MRHLKAGKILGRNSAHRKALFRNLVTALIQRERIQTTLAKAKELRRKAEKTITLGKKGSLHARRRALAILNEKSAMQKLFGPLAERYASRNGGYTRIIKVGNRLGDDAPMAIVELVDRLEKKSEPKKGKDKPKTAVKTKLAEDKGKQVKETETKKKATKKIVTKPEKKEAKSEEKKEKKTKKTENKQKKTEKKSETKTQKTVSKKDPDKKQKKK